MELDRHVGARQKSFGRVARLALALGRTGQHHVAGLQAGPLLGQRQQRATRTDLDVVGMGTDDEQRQRPSLGRLEIERQHVESGL